jgi:hypothetical protein
MKIADANVEAEASTYLRTDSASKSASNPSGLKAPMRYGIV